MNTSRRVVSLVPSSTETLLALGAEVVACTRFCEQPDLLHVGGTKTPDLDAIVELRPDVVVMDREENRLEDHDALVAAGLDVFVSDVRSVDAAIALVGELVTGTDPVSGDAADRYPTVELDEVAALSPDLVLVPSEPYAFTDGHVAELGEAFPRSRILRVDGQDLFWWGARTPHAIERLAAAL